MTKFCATEFRPDGEYGVELEAADWAEAGRVCEENGWRLDGELRFTIPATDTFGIEEANELIAVLDEREEAVRH